MPKVAELANIKVIAFDWDGTIVDSVPYKMAQNQAIAHEFGRNMSLNEVHCTWNEAAGFSDLMYRLTGSHDLGTIMKIVERDYNDPAYAKREFVFAKAALQHAREFGYKTAVVTNVSDEIIKMDAQNLNFDLAKDFDFVVTSDNSDYRKPDGRVFNPILRHLGITANRLLYIGDELKDYQAAQNAGAHFLGVTTGMMTTVEMDERGITYVPDISYLGLFNEI